VVSQKRCGRREDPCTTSENVVAPSLSRLHTKAIKKRDGKKKKKKAWSINRGLRLPQLLKAWSCWEKVSKKGRGGKKLWRRRKASG